MAVRKPRPPTPSAQIRRIVRLTGSWRTERAPVRAAWATLAWEAKDGGKALHLRFERVSASHVMRPVTVEKTLEPGGRWMLTSPGTFSAKGMGELTVVYACYPR